MIQGGGCVLCEGEVLCRMLCKEGKVGGGVKIGVQQNYFFECHAFGEGSLVY